MLILFLCGYEHHIHFSQPCLKNGHSLPSSDTMYFLSYTVNRLHRLKAQFIRHPSPQILSHPHFCYQLVGSHFLLNVSSPIHPHGFCGPWRSERLGLPQTPLPSTAPHKVSSKPPFSGEPCGWACACGESHPSIILVTDRHEADGDNIPSQLPTDESPSRCRPEASGFFSLRNISVPTQWLNVAARVRQAHICAFSSLHPSRFQGLVESP